MRLYPVRFLPPRFQRPLSKPPPPLPTQCHRRKTRHTQFLHEATRETQAIRLQFGVVLHRRPSSTSHPSPHHQQRMQHAKRHTNANEITHIRPRARHLHGTSLCRHLHHAIELSSSCSVSSVVWCVERPALQPQHCKRETLPPLAKGGAHSTRFVCSLCLCVKQRTM